MGSKSAAISLVVVALAFLAAGVWFVASTANDVPIQAEYDGKIVYERDAGTPQSALERHCAAQGGTFNICGTSCAPGAEVCTKECALTCELPREEDHEWKTYTHPDESFTIEYRSDMTVTTRPADGDDAVHFSLWGPTQQRDTEFYDGVSVTIYSKTLAEDETLREIVDAEVAQIRDIGEVLEPVTATALAGLSGYTFRAYTVGAPMDRIYLALDDSRVLVINTGAPDPENQGFAQLVARMLDSLRIATTE
jgi:hypothetical protein